LLNFHTKTAALEIFFVLIFQFQFSFSRRRKPHSACRRISSVSGCARRCSGSPPASIIWNRWLKGMTTADHNQPTAA